MAFEIGSNAVIKVADSGDVLRDLSPYLTGGSLPREVEALEATHLGDTAKKYIPGLEDATISIEGDYDPTIDGWLDGIRRLPDQAFEYYPQGTSGGDVKYAGVCLLTKYEIKDDVGDIGKISAELQVSGSVTRSTV